MDLCGTLIQAFIIDIVPQGTLIDRDQRLQFQPKDKCWSHNMMLACAEPEKN